MIRQDYLDTRSTMRSLRVHVVLKSPYSVRVKHTIRLFLLRTLIALMRIDLP